MNAKWGLHPVEFYRWVEFVSAEIEPTVQRELMFLFESTEVEEIFSVLETVLRLIASHLVLYC